MSVLEAPRIMFGGMMSWDPITTNNYPTEYNEASASTSMDFSETVQLFRQDAASADAINGGGNWNPHGTHRSSFYDTSIVSVDVGAGVEKADPFVSAPIYLDAMLVDAEPYGAFTSQLFFDQMSLGIDGGCQILLPRTTRFTGRYINFNRLMPPSIYQYAASIASVTFQSSFALSDGLQVNAYDSPALQTLQRMLGDSGVLGITVRFNAYFTHYFDAATRADIDNIQAPQFIKNLADGGFQPNPARSKIVGVVGLWREGEPPHEPGDRAMLPSSQNKYYQTKYVGGAFARIDSNNVLSVDMANSVSEVDLQATKQDLGELTFWALDGTGGKTSLGTLVYPDYDMDSYNGAAGIVRLTLTTDQATAFTNGTLQLQDASNNVFLEEAEIRLTPMDPNLYINAGDTATTDVLVLFKGTPVTEGFQIVMQLDSASVEQSTMAATDENGIASFSITGMQGQVQGFVLAAAPPDPQAAINPQATNYMYIRTLADPWPPGGAPPATWQFLYSTTLSNWNAMAPCMDNWLDLSNPDQVKAYAAILKKLTDPANFESYRFMPVTRDMTPGQRQLLYDFLDGTAAAAPSAVEAAAPEKRDIPDAEQSRRMRRPNRGK